MQVRILPTALLFTHNATLPGSGPKKTMAYASRLKGSKTRRTNTPQTKRADKRQVKNNAGGYSFKPDCWKRLDRFLIMGAESGTYYVSPQTQVKRSVKALEACLKEDGVRTVDQIVDVSVSGRAAKNDHAVFALAYCASYMVKSDDRAAAATRSYALGKLNEVCRIGTHLFLFLKEVQELRGWGRGLRTAVMQWYLKRPVEKMAYQVAKYRNRHGSTHRDVLRRCGGARPAELSEAQEAVLRWVVVGNDFNCRVVTRAGEEAAYEYTYPAVDESTLPEVIVGLNRIQSTTQVAEAVRLIKKYRLTHEMVPTELQKSPDVWKALLQDMPLGAMARNLGRMTSNGALKALSKETKLVVRALGDQDKLRRSRLHPFALLNALMVYREGKGLRGALRWRPIQAISSALEQAFYDSFKNIEPSGASHLLAIDVSGSMRWNKIENTMLTPAQGAAVMAMVTARTETNSEICAFSHTMVPVDITAADSLETVLSKLSRVRMGGTDCALPMQYALKHGLNVDHFVVYTDGETYAGRPHPHQALQSYRARYNKNAKLSVVTMENTNISIADPNDAGMMDISGFDSSTPRILAEFAKA